MAAVPQQKGPTSEPKQIVVQPPSGNQPSKVTSQPVPPVPTPSTSAAASAGVAKMGSAVPQVVMPGVTAENFTTFTKEQLITGYGNKSNAIRGLAALGLKPGPISTHLEIRYQHARNVLKRPLKRVEAEVRAAEKAQAASATSSAPATEVKK